MDSLTIFVIGIFACVIVGIICDTIKDIKTASKDKK